MSKGTVVADQLEPLGSIENLPDVKVTVSKPGFPVLKSTTVIGPSGYNNEGNTLVITFSVTESSVSQ